MILEVFSFSSRKSAIRPHCMGQEKSGSRPISRVLSWTIIHLDNLSPGVSSNLPESTCGPQAAQGILSYLVLLREGFTLPLSLLKARCALTAPFHPYRIEIRRYIFCGTFHRLTPPRRYLAPRPMEPGLSSTASSSDRLADSQDAKYALFPCMTSRSFQTDRSTRSRPGFPCWILLLSELIKGSALRAVTGRPSHQTTRAASLPATNGNMSEPLQDR